jgi:hypothetical protein
VCSVYPYQLVPRWHHVKGVVSALKHGMYMQSIPAHDALSYTDQLPLWHHVKGAVSKCIDTCTSIAEHGGLVASVVGTKGLHNVHSRL